MGERRGRERGKVRLKMRWPYFSDFMEKTGAYAVCLLPQFMYSETNDFFDFMMTRKGYKCSSRCAFNRELWSSGQ